MARKQEIGNALFDHILMTTIPTHEFAFRNVCFEE